MVRNLLILILFFLFYLDFYAQPNLNNNSKNNNTVKPFEGSIQFIQQTLNDTLYYTYHVKERKVRVDIHEKCISCEGPQNSLLFDLDKKTITAISPSRKMFINLEVKPYRKIDESQFTIIKSENTKVINGYKCQQWRVRNKTQNTEITYWVANDGFQFFEEFLRLWNRTEKHAQFYLQIPDIIGFFPMLSEERTLLRDHKMKLAVTDIRKKPVEQNLFDIPKDYKSYDQ
jgi:hypothetical protein